MATYNKGFEEENEALDTVMDQISKQIGKNKPLLELITLYNKIAERKQDLPLSESLKTMKEGLERINLNFEEKKKVEDTPETVKLASPTDIPQKEQISTKIKKAVKVSKKQTMVEGNVFH